MMPSQAVAQRNREVLGKFFLHRFPQGAIIIVRNGGQTAKGIQTRALVGLGQADEVSGRPVVVGNWPDTNAVIHAGGDETGFVVGEIHLHGSSVSLNNWRADGLTSDGVPKPRGVKTIAG